MRAVYIAGLVFGWLATVGLPPASAQEPAREQESNTWVHDDLPAASDTTPSRFRAHLGAAVLGIQPIAVERVRAPAQDTVVVRPERRGPFLLMIVGATGMLAGLLADSTPLALASAAVFGVGAYLYID